MVTVLFVIDQCGDHECLIEKIDSRLARNGGKTIAKRREYCGRPTPNDIPDWMKESSAPMETADGGMLDDSGSEEE